MICASVAIEGEEYLKQALEKGKGVIALGAHLRRKFYYDCPRVAAEGHPFSILVKHPPDAKISPFT